MGPPVLLRHGDADRAAPPAAAEYLARTLPAATLYIMRGAAHVPFVSHPRDTVAQLETFFDGQ
jgi:pimeloyl-[acyl-carrier protein] methyl ester esterase